MPDLVGRRKALARNACPTGHFAALELGVVGLSGMLQDPAGQKRTEIRRSGESGCVGFPRLGATEQEQCGALSYICKTA
jgi:hypothetical protein